jgi:GT2 family glycosyltransferase
VHTTSNPISDDVREAIEHLDRARGQAAEARQRVDELRRSRRGQLWLAWNALRGLFVPRAMPEPEVPAIGLPQSSSAGAVRAVIDCGPIITIGDPYERWIADFGVRRADVLRLRAASRHLAFQPKISILMPVYRTAAPFLRAAIDSVIDQAYPNWELCIVDDGSDLAELTELLAAYTAHDSRIRVESKVANAGISAATNDALAMATGEFIGLLDHDDVLQPHALFANALAINDDPTIDMLYSDEDKLDENGRRIAPYFKPDWSPETILSKMYTCHFGVYRRSIALQIGGFRSAFDGAQDWDFVLRFTEATSNVHHIPDVLYSWRLSETSAAMSEEAKPYAYVAARQAIADALLRRNEAGRVVPLEGYAAGTFYVRYEIRGTPRVTIIIPTRDRADLLEPCVVSVMQKSTYSAFEIIIVDNASVEPETRMLFASLQKRYPAIRVVEFPELFNYSRINNFAVGASSGDMLLFLNNDTEVITSDWIESLVQQAQREAIGAVGSLLLYGDHTIQHAGVILGIGGIAGHSHRHFPADTGGYVNAVVSPTNYSAVTAAALMVRRPVFDEVGGFDERFSVAYNDVDLCLRIRRAGYRNVFVPGAKLFHLESKSRGYDVTTEQLAVATRERNSMLERWGTELQNDPYYSPHLTLEFENFAMRILDSAN